MHAESSRLVGFVSVVVLVAGVSPVLAAPEACCFDPTGCLNLEPGDCSIAGGTPRGAGTTCAGVDCSSSGSCCEFGGGCSGGLSGFICTDSGGTYHGNGTSCQVSETTCNDGDDNDCDGDTDCTDDDCVAAAACLGACCNANGTCEDALTEPNCNGAFQGSGSTCGSVTCPDVTGACCLTGGGCLELALDDCDVVPNSGWAGPFTTCGGSFPAETGLNFCCDGYDNDCDGLADGEDTDCAAVDCTAHDDCAEATVPLECQNLVPDLNLGVCSVSQGPPNILEVCDMTIGTPPRHDCAAAGATCGPLPVGTDGFRCQFATDNRFATTDGPNTQGGSPPTCFASGLNAFQADNWYQFVAPCNGSMTVHNCGANNTYDSMLQVYSNNTSTCVGCPIVNNTNSKACSDDNCGTAGGGSALRVSVVNGGCYTIRMGGHSETGDLEGADTGISGLDIGVVCDVCACGSPPAIPPAPHNRAKNRYLSFAPNNPGQSVAFRVAKTANPANTGRCTVTGNVCTGAGQGTCGAGQTCVKSYPAGNPGGDCWVQTPVQTANAIPAQDNQYTAKCGPSPVFRVWTEPVIHVGDCAIIPATNYTIFMNLPGPVEIPTGLAVATAGTPWANSKLWGDLVGSNNGVEWTPPNGFASVNDVTAVLALQNGNLVRPHFTVCNIRGSSSGDSCLNQVVSTSDIQAAVQAITGASYGPPTTSQLVDPEQCTICP